MQKRIDRLRIDNEIDKIKTALTTYKIDLVDGSEFSFMNVHNLTKSPPSSENVVFLFSNNKNSAMVDFVLKLLGQTENKKNFKYVVLNFKTGVLMTFPQKDNVDVIVAIIRRNLTCKAKSCSICMADETETAIVCQKCTNIVCVECMKKIKIEVDEKPNKEGVRIIHKICPFCRYYM